MGKLLLIEILLASGYFLFLIFKKENDLDAFFVQKKHLNSSSLKEIVCNFEKINNTEYAGIKKNINQFFSKNKLSINQQERIDEYVNYMYFDGFKKPYTPFFKADLALKAFYILTLKISFIAFQFIILSAISTGKIEVYQYLQATLFSIIFFIIPVMFWLLQLGVVSLSLNMLCLIWPDKGALFRAMATLDELIKMMIPKRRKLMQKKDAYEYEDWGKFMRNFD